jgi:hypothetical protein
MHNSMRHGMSNLHAHPQHNSSTTSASNLITLATPGQAAFQNTSPTISIYPARWTQLKYPGHRWHPDYTWLRRSGNSHQSVTQHPYHYGRVRHHNLNDKVPQSQLARPSPRVNPRHQQGNPPENSASWISAAITE